MNRALAMWVAVCALVTGIAFAAPVRAQAVMIQGPTESTLKTVAPSFVVRALNFSTLLRPLRYTVFITLNSTGDSPYIDAIPFESPDTIVSIPVRTLLPAGKTVFWKARVTLPNGAFFESAIVGPKLVPQWLTLIEPNKSGGNGLTTRRPPFIWSSPKVDPKFGPWLYELQVTTRDPSGSTLAVLSTTISGDTTFQPAVDLDANTSYRWHIRASVNDGENVTVENQATFLITDRISPTTTVFYKNFPNPFPTPFAFSTCFWFDIGTGGARVKLDVLDLRGNLVQTIVDNVMLDAGAYGRGAEGSSSNCDGRFVWDGRASTGRTVAAGVYLARFSANGKTPTFVKIKFNGR